MNVIGADWLLYTVFLLCFVRQCAEATISGLERTHMRHVAKNMRDSTVNLALGHDISLNSSAYRLPIVFVYTVVPAVCHFGLPEYIRISVEQAIYTQDDCDVYLLSNIQECPQIAHSVVNVTGLKVIDAVPLQGERMRDFHNMSLHIFAHDGSNELWITSALRFFLLEDAMLHFGWREMLHVEADNMLYGKISALLPVLRRGYPLTATVLNTMKSFITASVFWVSSPSVLLQFNDYLLALGRNTDNRWKSYIEWLRIYACCKPGGPYPDQWGRGIKPFAINEMSMLAYYHELHPSVFRLVPVVPSYNYYFNRYTVNMSLYAPNGKETGLPTGHGIWDSNSWGQLHGGTSSKKGRDKGFTDSSHVAGQAIRLNGCKVDIRCNSNFTELGYMDGAEIAEKVALLRSEGRARCYTAPMVACGKDVEQGHFTPLWNLHVHAKHTVNYRSQPCSCQ